MGKYRFERPQCTYCGKRYGTPNYEMHRVYTKPGEPPPPLKTDLMVIKHTTFKFGMEVCHDYRLWDGKKLVGTHHRPFCSLKCALGFARAAFDEGRRYKLFELEDKT